jgi:hypothetical protein
LTAIGDKGKGSSNTQQTTDKAANATHEQVRKPVGTWTIEGYFPPIFKIFILALHNTFL